MHPSPCLRINPGSNQSNVTSPSPNGPKCSLPQIFISTVPSKPTQDGEFQDQTASACATSFRRFLRRLRFIPAKPVIRAVTEDRVQRRLCIEWMPLDTIPQINSRIGKAGICVEGRQNAIRQISRQSEKLAIINEPVLPLDTMSILRERGLVPRLRKGSFRLWRLVSFYWKVAYSEEMSTKQTT